MIEVIYFGEAGVHRSFDAEGGEHALKRGVPTPVPEELAERLCERECFCYADEAQGSEESPLLTAPDPEDGPRVGETITYEDPEGVNAADPYVEE